MAHNANFPLALSKPPAIKAQSPPACPLNLVCI